MVKMRRHDANQFLHVLPAICATLFAIFPLTDTDIWWHLACAREWVTTWTPVRAPIVNVHEYFQFVVGFVYGLGGAPLLVAFKAVLWGAVFTLFLRRLSVVCVFLLFIFRYHFEIRPVLFSLLFLGVYWNVLPRLFCHSEPHRGDAIHKLVAAIVLLSIQWFWCKCQGLYILGPLFAALLLFTEIWKTHKVGEKYPCKNLALQIIFVVALFAMPFLHREGLNLFLYPFGLLDRLLGITPSAVIFASEIAENRSPITLLIAGENVLESALMIVLCVVGICYGAYSTYTSLRRLSRSETIHSRMVLMVTALLVLIAERNFVLFLPVFSLFSTRLLRNTLFYGLLRRFTPRNDVVFHLFRLLPLVLFAFLLGFWVRSLFAYDSSMVAYQRVPVDAAKWMKQNPHQGRLFNDDRAGGYLAFVNPADSIYIDGRFILKTSEFFERYLGYAKNPSLFLAEADSQNIDRAVFPLRYYARWDNLLQTLEKDSRWHLVYRDEYFIVFDKKGLGL